MGNSVKFVKRRPTHAQQAYNGLGSNTVSVIETNMPRRNDLKKILLLGSGPIIIGQACEFDYSGTQACKALRSEGYEVVLVNSNPATIMTDPETADRTYIEPLTPEMVEKVIAKERPDAMLPTMGGQTALNLAVALSKNGVLEKYGVELIGAKLEAIEKAEDRQLFKQAMARIGVPVCPSGIASNITEAKEVASLIGTYPLIIRPAFTMGGTGGGISYNQEEFEEMAQGGIEASPVSQILIEKSLLGWKEYELEVMRDLADNVVIICSIENLDPMGIHTGDSITVAPAQTLTDKEYQRLRDASIKIIREIGVETGGSNIQFAVNPVDGELIVIEMNPRVSRSSALASKATGFPIAKFAAKLAVGYTLDEISNDITKKTPASFEPTIDYVVTKIPRFAFEKFPGTQPFLTTQMKSVGEAMAIGRTFCESFQKALRSLETGRAGWGCDRNEKLPSLEQIRALLRTPNPERIFTVRHAMMMGMSVEEIYELTGIDPWFLDKMAQILETEKFLKRTKLQDLIQEQLLAIKQLGFSDRQIAFATKTTEDEVRTYRKQLGVVPIYKTVDTCAAEFEAFTPYHYSVYEMGSMSVLRQSSEQEQLTTGICESEVLPSDKQKVMILGGGPNRIGQGIEFDYCCCHASYALSNAGFETIMVNSNPETVSTDYDTSDRLYFEPLTKEDVLNIIETENPAGIIIQFGGQTPLKLAVPLQEYLEKIAGEQVSKGAGENVDSSSHLPTRPPAHLPKIWGTSPDSIDIAEDRERFEVLLQQLQMKTAPNGIARSEGEALAVARRIGYPVVVRPSYVLGGRAMEIVYSDEDLQRYMTMAVQVEPEKPVLVDKFLENAVEVDVDAIADSTGNVVIGGIMEHIEQAGIHSGDSACTLPTTSLPPATLETIRNWTIGLAKALNVVGLMNIQFAVVGAHGYMPQVYILEANPRASRTVPFVSKAIGVPLAKLASLIMSGKTLEELGFTQEILPRHIAVKEAVLPFDKFPGTDTLLGPEMRSTGEVMGIDSDFGKAFAKAELAANQRLPLAGTVFVSMSDRDKQAIVPVVKQLLELGFNVVATDGTRRVLQEHGLKKVELVLKIHEGRPHIMDSIKNEKINLILNTPSGEEAQSDGRLLRRTALAYKIPVITTIAGAQATTAAIARLQSERLEVKAIQEYLK
ncbi:carbamoyl phosphate synthetase large chain [Microseira wollei NIES-4236]|uniref:Carbamoyl phosphate synthase large chain n=2 Tax=Microseira wollei TaxID=467598 RepID=A0AAV3X2H4_9CYAN|nr:carbamoyl phosphate synthetase large chain [Microseira wollei NIES-4236]